MLRNKAFNVMLSDEDKARLTELSESRGYSRGQCLRDALHSNWIHLCRNVYTCANGRACFVPHMHTESCPPTALNAVESAISKSDT